MRHDLNYAAREIASVQGRSAHLQVGAVLYVSAVLLSTAASALYRRHGATLTLHRATTDQLVPMLRGHELDCVISRATSTLVADDLTHHVLYRQRPCLVAHVASARRLRPPRIRLGGRGRHGLGLAGIRHADPPADRRAFHPRGLRAPRRCWKPTRPM